MPTRQTTSVSVQAREIAVWDPLVRAGHWMLVIAFALAYLSGDEEAGGPAPLHVWSGYVVAGIVVLRVLWGFVGPRRARFSDFVCGPVSGLRYLTGLARGREPRYLGHSPAGGLMVVALLISLAGTVATGWMAYGERGKGPLAGSVSLSAPAAHAGADNGEPASRQGGSEGRGRSEGGESAVGELHARLANITLGLVILHVLGVGLASVVHRENLVAAMIHGKKRGES